ncbi:HlyD family secretion protein [Telmatobacter bradus]|uniref:HlyD family secretion protein n=1 Tax=Telmatobacter bradus TaxID=474953 RepID=UPI003B42AFD5
MMPRPCIALTLSLSLLLAAGCRKPQGTHWQGYGEGDFVNISSSQAGRLDALMGERGSTIVAGAPLFALESQSESEACDQARAQLKTAEAQLDDLLTGKRPPEVGVIDAQLIEARATLEQANRTRLRDEAQFKVGGITAQQAENSRSTVLIDEARVRELEHQIEVADLPSRAAQIRAQQQIVAADRAALAQAEWRLHQKSVNAPQQALVFDILYRTGEWIPAGSPIVRLLPASNIKLRFFVPEEDLATFHLGDSIRFHRDGVPDATARITYISTQAEYTPPVIYSNETRAKLVYMIEAHPDDPLHVQLHPGQPLEVTR